MRLLLILLLFPMAVSSQTLKTADFLFLVDNYRDDTARLVSELFKRGFKERWVIQVHDTADDKSLEIVSYENATDNYYTEFVSVYFKDYGNVVSYRSASKHVHDSWFADLKKLGFTQTDYVKYRDWDEFVFKKGRIGVQLYREFELTRYDYYELRVTHFKF